MVVVAFGQMLEGLLQSKGEEEFSVHTISWDFEAIARQTASRRIFPFIVIYRLFGVDKRFLNDKHFSGSQFI